MVLTNYKTLACNSLHLSKKRKCHHNLGPTSKKHNNEKEQTTQIPKTYDAIKSAAGADMKAKGKK